MFLQEMKRQQQEYLAKRSEERQMEIWKVQEMKEQRIQDRINAVLEKEHERESVLARTRQMVSAMCHCLLMGCSYPLSLLCACDAAARRRKDEARAAKGREGNGSPTEETQTKGGVSQKPRAAHSPVEGKDKGRRARKEGIGGIH